MTVRPLSCWTQTNICHQIIGSVGDDRLLHAPGRPERSQHGPKHTKLDLDWQENEVKLVFTHGHRSTKTLLCKCMNSLMSICSETAFLLTIVRRDECSNEYSAEGLPTACVFPCHSMLHFCFIAFLIFTITGTLLWLPSPKSQRKIKTRVWSESFRCWAESCEICGRHAWRWFGMYCMCFYRTFS